MTLEDRMYETYRDIARLVFQRQPLSREAWDAIPRRSYFRTATLPRHDDTEFDYAKEQQGDAQ